MFSIFCTRYDLRSDGIAAFEIVAIERNFCMIFLRSCSKKRGSASCQASRKQNFYLLFLTSASSSTPQATPARNISIAIGIDILHLLPLLHFDGNSNAADHQCQYQSCDKFLHVKFLQFFVLTYASHCNSAFASLSASSIAAVSMSSSSISSGS